MIEVTMTDKDGVVLATEDYACDQDVEVTPANAENIVASNIRNGVNILGVTGTLEEGADVYVGYYTDTTTVENMTVPELTDTDIRDAYDGMVDQTVGVFCNTAAVNHENYTILSIGRTDDGYFLTLSNEKAIIKYTDDNGTVTVTAKVIGASKIEWGSVLPTANADSPDFYGLYNDGLYFKELTKQYLPTLNDNTWDAISEASADRVAANYWSVGDTKEIRLVGTAGNMTLNETVNVFILGFDHNYQLEGRGISFGGFKTTTGTDICLVDSGYNSQITSGTWNNMNNSQTNSGGWKNAHIRYYLLGSTNTENADAGTTTATSPVANSLMSCLPSDLRAVMKPITKYTNNTGNSSSETAITTTVDYLPLLAEWEVFGATSYANSYEKNRQAQYAYYVNSAASKKVRYKHNTTSSSAGWWLRSARSGNASSFCFVGTSGAATNSSAYYSSGVAPGFLI